MAYTDCFEVRDAPSLSVPTCPRTDLKWSDRGHGQRRRSPVHSPSASRGRATRAHQTVSNTGTTSCWPLYLLNATRSGVPVWMVAGSALTIWDHHHGPSTSSAATRMVELPGPSAVGRPGTTAHETTVAPPDAGLPIRRVSPQVSHCWAWGLDT